jgi:hypothetical protein
MDPCARADQQMAILMSLLDNLPMLGVYMSNV